ncbi:MAG TPA: hypothetical protein PKV80_22195 [Leptospiraceae bacterium]|nr:hypothetical protein [Leptospiraceae bacterium]
MIATAVFFLHCSSAKEKEHPIEEPDILYSNYQNSKGMIIHKNIKVQMKTADALADIENFKENDYKKYENVLTERLQTVDDKLGHLKIDGWKYISAKSILLIALTSALIIPIPGTFETITAAGFIVMGVQRFRETEEDKVNRIKLSDLLDECAEAHDNLKELKKNSLPDFYKKWHKNFNDKNHHVKNISDPTDIRIYDRFWNTYTAEKEHIIKSIEIELEHADNQCSYIKLKPEINANQPKIENWSDSPK